MTDTAWHIDQQRERGDETVFRCYRHRDGKHMFVTVRVLTIWWRVQGSTADILRKAAEQHAANEAAKG